MGSSGELRIQQDDSQSEVCPMLTQDCDPQLHLELNQSGAIDPNKETP